jgi:transcriptional regulator with XRE-family HTH domain
MEGLELKIARIRANLKQWEFASKVGISQNRLSQFELGRKPIPPEFAIQIKRILNERQDPPSDA